MTDKPLKAYVVREDDEGSCAIVFATNSATARRNGANELGMEFEEVESCRREQVFDQYAPGPVPLLAKLRNGWWHGCAGCECRFDIEERDEPWRAEDNERDDALEPVEDSGGSAYCSPTCMMEEWAKRRQEKAQINAAIEACAITWPGATNISAGRYGRYATEVHQISAHFMVPGVRFHVQWKIGDSTVTVSQCDVEAWKAWRASH